MTDDILEDTEPPGEPGEEESVPPEVPEAGSPSLDAGSLALYLKKLRDYTLLSAEEEVSLAREVGKGNAAARERMILSNLRLVVLIAKRYVGRGLAKDEKRQKLVGAKGFEPSTPPSRTVCATRLRHAPTMILVRGSPPRNQERRTYYTPYSGLVTIPPGPGQDPVPAMDKRVKGDILKIWEKGSSER